MDELKEFGETRMFSPDAMHRFHRAVENGAHPPAPKSRASRIRVAVLLLLFVSAIAGLVWTYRAPLGARLSRITHRQANPFPR